MNICKTQTWAVMPTLAASVALCAAAQGSDKVASPTPARNTSIVLFETDPNGIAGDLLYDNSIQTGFRYHPGASTAGAQLLQTYDDVPIPVDRLDGETSIQVTKVTVGIRRLANAPAVDVTGFWTTLSTNATAPDTQLDTPGNPIGTVSLPANGATAVTTEVMFGDGTNPLFVAPLNMDIFQPANTFGAFAVGISMTVTGANPELFGWRITNGPDANADSFWEYDPNDNSEALFFFGGNPLAIFYIKVEGIPFESCDEPLGSCPADVHPAEGGNGVVNVDDLLTVINTWNQTGPPRPAGDCRPLPNGDCTVNVDDLLGVINEWGPCPTATGACCNAGICTDGVTEADCVDGGGEYQGNDTLCANVTCPTPDTCDNATVLAVGGSASDDLSDSTSDAAPACDGIDPGASFNGEWYMVMGNGNTLTAKVCGGAAQDVAVNVYCGDDCGDLTCVLGQNDDNGLSGGCGSVTDEAASWCSANGQPYWILVHAPTGGGPYTIQILNGAACTNPLPCGIAPLNDNCEDAIPISTGTTSYNTTGADTDGLPNDAGGQCDDFGSNNTHHDIWYTWTAPSTALMRLTTCSQLGGGSDGYDTDLVAYDTSLPGGNQCPPLDTSRVGCNDDDQDNICGTAAPWESTMYFNAQAGRTYLLRVGGWGEGNFGAGTLNFTNQGPATVCGNNIVEQGEQCDPPGGFCTAQCQTNAAAPPPNCPVGCDQTSTEPCATNEYVDTINGGCNSTPPAFTETLIPGQTLCGQVSTYQLAGADRRDTDWLVYTVGPSGNVLVNFKSQIPTVSFLITTGIPACPAGGILGLGWSDDNVCANYLVTGLTPGSTIAVFVGPGNPDGSGIFTGFPCGGPDGNSYEITVVSP